MIDQEKSFENRVKEFLQNEGFWFAKSFANGINRGGIPDFLVCCNGKFVGVKLKSPNKSPSELQLNNLKKIDESNGYSVLLSPDRFELFENFIFCLEADDQENADFNYRLLKDRWEAVAQSQ